ncbi:MAG TPA: DUF1761 domain-containing protein [Pyrinomonadaceae bacterium]|nr:DUF1761 domain-containing protein [Pyrinomonadaceae bacterium]
MFEVTFVPILVAGVANLILGMIWFHPRVFGTAWMARAGITPEMAEKGKKRMPIMAAIATLAAMLVAYVMNHFGIAWGVFDWIGAVELAFWCWLGFVAPTMLGMVLWEMKPIKYYAMVAGYWLVAFIMMAVILVSFA